MNRVRDRKAHRFDCVVVLIMAAALVSCGGSEPPPQREVVRPVKLLTVSSGMADAPRVYPGRIEAKDRVELSFRVGGPLIEFPVREGSSVRAGGVVARIDPRDFRIQLKAAQAERERTTADFRRHASLYAKDAVSQLQLDQARAAMEVAQARLDDARAALKDTTLYTPYSAQVAQRLVDNYQEVRPGQPIVTLVSLGEMKVEIDVPEGLVSRAKRGSAVRVTAMVDGDAAAGRHGPAPRHGRAGDRLSRPTGCPAGDPGGGHRIRSGGRSRLGRRYGHDDRIVASGDDGRVDGQRQRGNLVGP